MKAPNFISSPYYKTFLTILVLFILGGCSTSYDIVPGHKLHVQQGNLITKDMVKQLKVGMTKQQAKYILGSPILENLLGSNEYTYIYTEQNAQKDFHEKKLILGFDKTNKLISIKGSGVKQEHIGQYYINNNTAIS
tara:strand:+ start:15865 stop:16272 length:408 start_codon:yes stop_codon:yes gene_type:complete